MSVLTLKNEKKKKEKKRERKGEIIVKKFRTFQCWVPIFFVEGWAHGCQVVSCRWWALVKR